MANCRIRNVIIVSDYGVIEGGASKVAITTALEIARRDDINVYFIAGCGEICNELMKSTIEVIKLQEYDLTHNPSKVNAFLNGIYSKKNEKKLNDFFASFDSEATAINVHSWTKAVTSAVFVAAQKHNLPLFITVHDYFLLCPNGGFYNYQKAIICKHCPMTVKCLLSNCDSRGWIFKLFRIIRQYVQNRNVRKLKQCSLIFLSQFTKSIFEENGFNSHKNLYELHNPVSIEQPRIRVKCEKNENFLCIGRVCQEKGTDLFCEAISRIGAKGIVIGDGDLKETLMNRYEDISFTGWLNQEEIKKYIQTCRCVIFPSPIYEVSPLVIPEVQQFGIPCVVFDSCAAKDFIIDGENGFVTSKSVDTLVEKVLALCDNTLVKSLSICAFNSYNSESYTIEYIANKLLSIMSRQRIEDD